MATKARKFTAGRAEKPAASPAKPVETDKAKVVSLGSFPGGVQGV